MRAAGVCGPIDRLIDVSRREATSECAGIAATDLLAVGPPRTISGDPQPACGRTAWAAIEPLAASRRAIVARESPPLSSRKSPRGSFSRFARGAKRYDRRGRIEGRSKAPRLRTPSSRGPGGPFRARERRSRYARCGRRGRACLEPSPRGFQEPSGGIDIGPGARSARAPAEQIRNCQRRVVVPQIPVATPCDFLFLSLSTRRRCRSALSSMP